MKVIEAKIVVLGSQGVGKTSLVVRYIGKMFSKHISPTIGASFFTCNISVDDARVKLQVWDTAGQERFRAMAPMYYRNANAALLVFDISSAASFAAIKGWVKELQSNVAEAMVMSVVGNKSDLSERRAVPYSEAAQYAASIGAQYRETSALRDQWSPMPQQRAEAMVMSVVGNKSDLSERRAVPYSEAAQYAASIGAQYRETSALRDQGIDQVFLSVATALLKMSSSNGAIRSYDSADGESDKIPTGSPTEEAATHTGKVELPAWSVDSIAHGELQKSMCC